MANHPRVFIIHGYNATPRDAWLPWLERELRGYGIDVHVPQMPHPRWPYIHSWTATMREAVGVCDTDTYFIGHSLGGQAILRYLTTLPSDQRAGGAIFVGGFDRLRMWWPYLIISYIFLGRWLLSPIDWEKVRARGRKFIAFFSDDDGWVEGQSGGCFQRFLSAKIRVLHGYGHFTGNEGVFSVPEVLDEVLRMVEQKNSRDARATVTHETVFHPFIPLRT